MNETLRNLIAELQISGKTTEEIYVVLLQQGYQVKDIAEAMRPAGSEQEERTATKKERQRLNVVQIVSYVGAVLIALGVFSFVAANWSGMFRSVKIITLLGLVVSAYAGGWICEEKQMRRTAGALYMLGSLVFGASIFLIGQIFNARGNWADGFIFWMIGVIPLAWVLQRSALWSISILVGLIGAVGYPFGFNWFWRFEDPLIFTAVPLLILALVVPFVVGLLIRKEVREKYPEFY
jgi:uncharacterized membrane protein